MEMPKPLTYAAKTLIHAESAYDHLVLDYLDQMEESPEKTAIFMAMNTKNAAAHAHAEAEGYSHKEVSDAYNCTGNPGTGGK